MLSKVTGLAFKMAATPACDRRMQSRVALQRCFIDSVYLKLFAPLAQAFPAAGAPLLAQLLRSISYFSAAHTLMA
jgi:hypothetical protein